MSDTLLEIAKRACAVIGVPQVTQLAGSTETRSINMLALFNKEVREQRIAKFWPSLAKFGTITTVVDTESYDLPADFDAIVPATLYPDTGARVRGASNPVEWAAGKSFLSLQSYPAFRIIGNPKKLYLQPAPQLVQNYGYEYRSKYAVAATDDTPKEYFTADDDYPLIDAGLLELGFTWRYKAARGLAYAEDFREYSEKQEQIYAQQLATGPVYLGQGRVQDTPLTEGYVTDIGYGA